MSPAPRRPARAQARVHRWTLTEGPDGVLRVRWDRGIRIEEDDAVSLIARVNLLAAGGPRPILIDLNGIMSVSVRSLNAFAGDHAPLRVALLGSSAVEDLLAEFFRRVHTPPFPVAYFRSRRRALEWLRQQGASEPR